MTTAYPTFTVHQCDAEAVTVAERTEAGLRLWRYSYDGDWTAVAPDGTESERIRPDDVPEAAIGLAWGAVMAAEDGPPAWLICDLDLNAERFAPPGVEPTRGGVDIGRRVTVAEFAGRANAAARHLRQVAEGAELLAGHGFETLVLDHQLALYHPAIRSVPALRRIIGRLQLDPHAFGIFIDGQYDLLGDHSDTYVSDPFPDLQPA